MLAGVRILDATRLLPGPYAGWLLALMGAEVIKVERPGMGDPMRQNWPRRGGVSTVFHLYNGGKRSVALDLKQEDGVRAFLDLAATCDVVMDGNRPGVMDRLGCGWEACRRARPSLVYCAITGFGQDGPFRDRVGHDINYLSLVGAMTGLVDEAGRPVAPRVTLADMAGGGLMAVGALLAALLPARELGEGRFVDVSMTDTILSIQGLRIAEELLPGDRKPTDDAFPPDNDNEFGTYATSDGRFITLDPWEARFKDILWSAIEGAGWGERPGPRTDRPEVRAALAAVVASRSLAEWEALLDGKEVPYAPVLELVELADSPQIAFRGSLGDGLDPTVPSPSLGDPVRFEPPARPDEVAPAPEVGADTIAELTAIGWSSEEIEQAVASGAVATSVEKVR